jgi:cell division septation protein DedD
MVIDDPLRPYNTAGMRPVFLIFLAAADPLPALSRAENVKQTLADKGITSIIENQNIGDTLYFRVRIGPYTSQNEADYWLNLIRAINGFEKSEIRKTQTIL